MVSIIGELGESEVSKVGLECKYALLANQEKATLYELAVSNPTTTLVGPLSCSL